MPLPQQVLAAGEIRDERRGLLEPRDVAVDVRAREILDAGHAELLRRAGEGVPHELVDSVDEALVARAFQHGGRSRPVAHHVRKGLGGRQPFAVDMRGVGLRPAHLAAAPIGAGRVPELALRHVRAGEEGQLVGLAEDLRRPDPRPARLGMPLQPVLVRKCQHGAVEVLAETVVARSTVVAQERPRRLFTLDHEARQNGQPRPDGVAAVLGELPLESAGPRRHRALPAHAVEVRQCPACQRAGIGQDRLAHAVEVPLHRLRVEHVHVVLVAVDGRKAETHQRPLARRHVPGETALRVDLIRQFDDLHRRAVFDGGLHTDSFAGSRPHRVQAVAGIDPLRVACQRRTAIPDGEGGDVPEVFPVGPDQGRGKTRSSRQGRGLANQPLGRVAAHLPRPFERPRATAEVDADL